MSVTYKIRRRRHGKIRDIRNSLRLWLARFRGLIGDSSLLNVPEAAAFADVSPHTINNWVRRGLLPATKSGRARLVLTSDLASLLRGNPSRLAIVLKGQISD